MDVKNLTALRTDTVDDTRQARLQHGTGAQRDFDVI